MGNGIKYEVAKMQRTTNLNLKKPELTDNVNIGDLNDNADILDGYINKISENFEETLNRLTFEIIGAKEDRKNLVGKVGLISGCYVNANNGKIDSGNSTIINPIPLPNGAKLLLFLPISKTLYLSFSDTGAYDNTDNKTLMSVGTGTTVKTVTPPDGARYVTFNLLSSHKTLLQDYADAHPDKIPQIQVGDEIVFYPSFGDKVLRTNHQEIVSVIDSYMTPESMAATVNIENPIVNEYIENVDYSNDTGYVLSSVRDYNGYTGNYARFTGFKDYAYRMDEPRGFLVRWKPRSDLVALTATISKNSDMSYDIPYQLPVDATQYTFKNMIPNVKQYYKVCGLTDKGEIVTLANGNFTPTGTHRMLSIDGIQNVRDIGGWACNGGTVAYGKIYRGSEMDFANSASGISAITGAGREELRRRGVKFEIDLRGLNSEGRHSALGYDIGYTSHGIGDYDNVITEHGVTPTSTQAGYQNALKNTFNDIVQNLSDSKPMYVHCMGGNDRTGTLISVLLAVLGVSESDISKEYELSAFSRIGCDRKRNGGYRFNQMMLNLKGYNGNTIADKAETFMIGIGVTAEKIATYRTQMIVT